MMDGIEVLNGQTLLSIETTHDTMDFYTVDGKHYRMFHYQDCCESVTIDDIVGDLDDLLGMPILEAREATNRGGEDPDLFWREYYSPEDYVLNKMAGFPELEEGGESYTWTFYILTTIKGSVTIKWYGSSNGYYSESVYFEEV
jgi:hypothetical protein